MDGTQTSVLVINSCGSVIQQNRDYYDTIRPGYVPYVYPHPLSVQGETGRLLNLHKTASSSQINLSWDSISGTTGFGVSRNWAPVIQVPGATIYQDNTPVQVYIVYAYDSGGKVLAMEGVNTDDQAPSAPTNLRAPAVTSSSVTLAWDASTDNFGVIGYRVYQGSNPVSVANVSGVTTATVFNLHAATPYFFTVAAYDAGGNESAQSGPASATTKAGFTISGQVTLNGAGLANVIMSGLPTLIVTDTNGDYTATVDQGWSCTVTPLLSGYTFTPPSTIYSGVASNQIGNYTAVKNAGGVGGSGGSGGGGGGGGGCFIIATGNKASQSLEEIYHQATPVLIFFYLGLAFLFIVGLLNLFLFIHASDFYKTDQGLIRQAKRRKDMKYQRIGMLFLVLSIFSAHVRAQIVPPDRQIDWSQSGVPGGIPNRTTIGATVDAAYGTGLVDATAAIETAIDNCPAGQVIYIPAGTYRIDSRVYRPYASNITIRGAGMGQTILKSNSNDQVIVLGTGDYPRPTNGVAITDGASKGNDILTVTNASSFVVGNLVRFEQDNLTYVISGTAPTTNTKAMSAMFRVTAKTANTVTVFPKLPFDFTASPRLIQYSIAPLCNTGVEDLTLDGNAMASKGIEIDQSWGCWVKNVEIKNIVSRQMFLVNFVNGEIRHNYTHDVIGTGPNKEGIDLYEDCSFNLIEDNITYRGGYPGIILGDSRGGCTGNVIAYNFCYATISYLDTTAGMDISVSHGPHNMMNLVEGNIAGGFGSDGYYGSTSHITVLRNWFTATHPTATENLLAVNVGRWQDYFSFVGNILGTSSFSPAGLYQPETPFGYLTPVIYKLGFPNMGNNAFSLTWGPTAPPDYRLQSANQPGGDSHGTRGSTLQELDLNVKNTMIRHGNYDYFNHAVLWEATISDHNIPNSYFRTSKPAYFGNLSWPPIDPASPPGVFNNATLCKIPSGYRFVNGVDPGTVADTTPPSVPTGLHTTAVSSAQIDLLWTASTDNVATTGYRIYRDGTQIATSATNAYSNNGLNPNTQYFYTVTACDAALNESAPSSGVTVMTLGSGGGGGGDSGGGGGGGCFIAAVQGVSLWFVVLGFAASLLVWVRRRAKRLKGHL